MSYTCVECVQSETSKCPLNCHDSKLDLSSLYLPDNSNLYNTNTPEKQNPDNDLPPYPYVMIDLKEFYFFIEKLPPEDKIKSYKLLLIRVTALCNLSLYPAIKKFIIDPDKYIEELLEKPRKNDAYYLFRHILLDIRKYQPVEIKSVIISRFIDFSEVLEKLKLTLEKDLTALEQEKEKLRGKTKADNIEKAFEIAEYNLHADPGLEEFIIVLRVTFEVLHFRQHHKAFYKAIKMDLEKIKEKSGGIEAAIKTNTTNYLSDILQRKTYFIGNQFIKINSLEEDLLLYYLSIYKEPKKLFGKEKESFRGIDGFTIKAFEVIGLPLVPPECKIDFQWIIVEKIREQKPKFTIPAEKAEYENSPLQRALQKSFQRLRNKQRKQKLPV
jgi:hypothetical protein